MKGVSVFFSILSKLAWGVHIISQSIYMPPQKKLVIEWQKANGDKTLRLDYELNASSTVFDVGGYEGQWASDIYSMYCCRIHIFEPVSEFTGKIKKRFIKNKNIFVHDYGLSDKNEEMKISLEKDASSVLKNSGYLETIRLVKASDFIKQNNINHIDLLKLNIEGKEYDLLDHLISAGLITKIENIQVQFHDFVPKAKERMQNIQGRLQKTHILTYQYPFVWENWKSIKDNDNC